jgi:hypothetical protein
MHINVKVFTYLTSKTTSSQLAIVADRDFSHGEMSRSRDTPGKHRSENRVLHPFQRVKLLVQIMAEAAQAILAIPASEVDIGRLSVEAVIS